jgi:hypothetical protein
LTSDCPPLQFELQVDGDGSQRELAIRSYTGIESMIPRFGAGSREVLSTHVRKYANVL